jgi:hypothetical protein
MCYLWHVNKDITVTLSNVHLNMEILLMSTWHECLMKNLTLPLGHFKQ